MEVYVVMSRDKGLVGIYSTIDLAEAARDKAVRNEEMGGGRPTVWISERTSINKL